MTENDIIRLITSLAKRPADDVILGIGDDAAALDVPGQQALVTCTDTLVAGIHFPSATLAENVGFKALAVNLSDLAAMGAWPRWAQLSLTMPGADEAWVTDFMAGFMALADRYSVVLVGGDTCKGPLSVTVQVLGFADRDKLLQRGMASAGELIAVSGQLGDAALALECLNAGQAVTAQVLSRLQQPEPRLDLGRKIPALASSCIDISDGLLLDLGRLLEHSGCGAKINLPELPGSGPLLELPDHRHWQLQLSGGDDYELCFTVHPAQLGHLEELSKSLAIPISIIGEVTASNAICCYDAGGQIFEPQASGYQHFEGIDGA